MSSYQNAKRRRHPQVLNGRMNALPNGKTLALLVSCFFASGVATSIATAQTAKLALEGFCTIAIHEENQWTAGRSDLTTIYGGREYRFSSEEAQSKFVESPAQYVPALGGDCSVCLVETGNRIGGRVHHSVRHKGRLFLFPDTPTKQKFKDNLPLYENCDLALSGNCPIANKKGESATGDKQFVAFHDDYRYHCASTEALIRFLRTPEYYANR